MHTPAEIFSAPISLSSIILTVLEGSISFIEGKSDIF
jgi:hypothetical protein